MKTLLIAVLAVFVLGLVFTPTTLATSTDHFLGYDLIYHDDGHIERVDGAQNYIRYDGTIEPTSLMEEGTVHYPYLAEETVNDRKYTIEGKSIFIPKTFDVATTSGKISPSKTYTKTQLVNNMEYYNETVSYLVFQHSLSTVRDWATDNGIGLGRWRFDAGAEHITISDEDGNILSPEFYEFRIVNGEIRLYFVRSEANALTGDITFQMHSWNVIDYPGGWSGVTYDLFESYDPKVLEVGSNLTLNYQAINKNGGFELGVTAPYNWTPAFSDGDQYWETSGNHSNGVYDGVYSLRSYLYDGGTNRYDSDSFPIIANEDYTIKYAAISDAGGGAYPFKVEGDSTINVIVSVSPEWVERTGTFNFTDTTSSAHLQLYHYDNANYSIDNVKVYNSQNVSYYNSGSIFTSIYDAGSGYKLYQVSTNGTYTAGQTADIYVNTSSDNSTWSDWQLVQPSAVSGTAYDVPSAYQKRYYQVKATLETDDVSLTPVLENIRSNTAVDAPAGDGIIYVSANGDGDYNCDGTDDQVQINQAFAEVEGNASLTTVYLKDDGGAIDYIISDQIEMCDDSHFTGALGVKVQLEGGLTENDFEQMVTGNTLISGKVYNRLTDAEISNIFFDGNRDNWGGDPDDDDARETISIRGSGISIHDCTFDNGVGDAIRIANYGEFEPDVEIYDNEFWKSGHCNIYILYTGSTGDNRVWIHDNNLNEVYSNAGIRFDDVSGSLIENNTITADPGHPWSDMPIYISYVGDSGSGTYCHDNEIRYNKIYGSYREHGILLVSRYNGAVIKSETTGNHIHHNLIYKGLGYDGNAGGINVYGIDGALVEYNTIYGGQGDGITSEEYLSYSMTTTGFVVTVENNIIQGMTYYSGTFAGYGISNHEASQVTINSDYNNIYDCAGGAYSGVTPGDNDTSVDALFYDTANDIYTLKSTFGVWDGDSWETTETQSPCIDGADPADSYSNEPEDNGDLPNLGRWGNTIYASKSGVGEGWENISDIFWYVGFRETVGTSGNRLRFGSPTVNDTEVANFDVVVS